MTISKRQVLTLLGLGLFVSSLGCSKKESAAIDANALILQGLKKDSAVDILFVVSNSSSMAANQAKVAAEAKSLVEALNRSAIDWHLALTSADMSSTGSGGDFLGTPNFLSPLVSQSEQVLADMITSLGRGSDIEKAFDSARTALNPVSLGIYSPDFLRPKARLILIFVSDSDDMSSSSAADFARTLNSLKSNSPPNSAGWTAYLYGVLSAQDPCYRNTVPVLATHYLDLVKSSGGQAISICQNHITDFFSDLQ